MASLSVDFDYMKTVIASVEQLQRKHGLRIPEDVQPIIDNPLLGERLVRYIREGCPEYRIVAGKIVYSADTVSRILGLSCTCNDPVPQARDGEVIIYYGGWALKTLRTCTAGQKRMRQDWDWYEQYPWEAEPGYYRLLLPVPHSQWRSWSGQLRLLASIGSAWQPAPVCIAATAVLVHLMKTGNNLLQHEFVLDEGWRCAETIQHGFHVGLRTNHRVYVYNSQDDWTYHDLNWLAAAQKVRILQP